MANKLDIIAIPPGETIKEMLEDRCISQLEFAERMGSSTKFISQLINGKVALTHQTALKLESVLGVPARFWNNLESLYQEDLAKLKQQSELEAEASIVKSFPYADMANKNWVKQTKKPAERVEELRGFYEVASLKNIKNINKLSTVFRKVDHGKASEYALSAWLQKGFLEGRDIQTRDFNKRRLISVLPQIRALANESPQDFIPKLSKLLSDCGVALIFLPHLKNTYAHGATVWMSKQKAFIILSIRGKDADKFWFSLFHEIGHLVLHEKDSTFIQYDEENLRDSHETEADHFASNSLIPQSVYHEFVSEGNFSEDKVNSFADKISIPAGIVVGRLQHDQRIKFNQLNHLKVKYEWAEVDDTLIFE
ncbi:ImmA/IrrE family metallo-endopeptidase [Acidaminobacter hydrogenoformans]|uniref:HTH-type transcriptional regulator / antitoxin HigA n=1 Tax=Acidaminobacter hydrogenoformans DSM 2784 TaxID=1120920 RepID=A0A1G5S6J9_9FIRM|nr:ImmA/IrrE family metallo-endopeptidase [Acidaminobacter hydrogenoformans]SCZ81838.1 HTH-type transcriptional regulator / antitoxin HigA [Acidaminobacter hydrogenoformans DSM 2784]